MTDFGHILTGASLGALCMPRRWRWPAKAALLLAFSFLSIVPDLPFRGWGHDKYHISHSLLLNLLIPGVQAFLLGLWPAARRALGGAAVLAMGVAAELSHLLLDSFYNHGRGVVIGWPVNRYALNLRMPWFTALWPGWNLAFAREVGTEMLFYGTILLICIAARKAVIRSAPRRRTGGSAAT
jgi:hypothetical protein